MPTLPGWSSLEATSRLHSVFEITGIVLLALLVVAEALAYQYGHRSDDLSAQRQDATQKKHDEEMARLRRDTAALTADAEQSRAAIAAANARAAQAQLELAELKAPRNVKPDQQAAVVDAIKGFSGQHYSGLLSSGPDTQSFWTLLNAMLRKAGWRRVSSGGVEVGNPPAGVGLNLLPGVYIGYAREEDEGRTAAAEKLAAALSLAGIAASAGVDTAASQDPRTIRIAIGVKPQ